MWREAGRQGLGFCKSLPHLHAQRVCASGPAPNRGCGPAYALYPSCIHPVEPGQGWAGAGGVSRLPVGCQGVLAATPPPASIPHAGTHASAPAACKDRQREGSGQSQGPLHPPPRLLVLPASLPYTTQPSSARAALAPPPQPSQSPRATQRETRGAVRLPPQPPSIPALSAQGGGTGGSTQCPPSLLSAAADHPSPH